MSTPGFQQPAPANTRRIDETVSATDAIRASSGGIITAENSTQTVIDTADPDAVYVENEGNYRTRYRDAELKELGQSLLLEGQEQEIVCDTMPDGRRRLVCGHKRRLSAKDWTEGRHTKLRALIINRELSRGEILQLQLAENHKRSNPDTADEAAATGELYDLANQAHKEQGGTTDLTTAAFAKQIGRDRATVQRLLDINREPSILAFARDVGITALRPLDDVRKAIKSKPRGEAKRESVRTFLDRYRVRFGDVNGDESARAVVLKEMQAEAKSLLPTKAASESKLRKLTTRSIQVTQPNGMPYTFQSGTVLTFKDGRGTEFELTIND